jgi:hypothetical protein
MEEKYDEIKIVSEIEMMVFAKIATQEDPSKDNLFSQMLETASEFKKAGMTPIYIINETKGTLRLAAMETYGRLLN